MICLLIVLGMVVSIFILQRKNLLSPLFILAKEYLPLVIEILGLFCAALAVIFAQAFCESHVEESDENDQKDCINYRGEYSDKYKHNWY